MKRSILLLCAAPLLVLTACMGGTATAPTSAGTAAPSPSAGPTATPTPAPAGVEAVVAKADGAVDRASAAYHRVKPTIDVLVRLLPTDYADRVTMAQSILERSLRAAKVASTAAAQLLELRKAEAQMRDIEAVIGKSPATD